MKTHTVTRCELPGSVAEMNDRRLWKQRAQNPAYRNLRAFSATFLSVFFVLQCTASSACAGTLTIIGIPKLKIVLTATGVSVSGSYAIVNRGNEIATEVLPELTLGGWIYQGDPRRLEPNQQTSWEVRGEIPFEELTCERSNDCGGLNLPQRGNFPFRVRRLYKDLNGAPFSSLEIGFAPLGAPPIVSRNTNVKVTGHYEEHGEGTTLFIEVRSSDNIEREVGVALQTPREFPLSATSQRVKLTPGQSEIIKFETSLAHLTPGSMYYMFPVVQWEENGLRMSTFGSFPVEVVRKKRTWPYITAGGVVFILLTAIYLLGTRTRNEKMMKE